MRPVVAGLLSMFALVAGLAAQEVGGGAEGGFSSGREAGGGVRAPTRFEQFIGKLKMDSKAQAPLVTALLQDVAKDASAVGAQMAQLQNQLLNALLLNKAEAEITPILDAYRAAAARMTGLEGGTFGKIYAMLKPNQQGGAVQAFDLMAGWLQPPAPTAGGRGGGRRGAGGAGNLPRLDILIDAFTLTKDQEKAAKTLMDDAGKSAMPIRDALAKTRPGIVAAIQGGKGQADIDAAVNAYAVQATAMAELETRALAKLMQALTPEQRANQAAVRSTFVLMRGAFLSKSWNEAPNPDKGY